MGDIEKRKPTRKKTGDVDKTKPKRRKSRSAWRDSTTAERAAGLMARHESAVTKARADAAAKGTPDHWAVSTSWADELDIPVSTFTAGPPDSAAHQQAIEALADFLVSAWLRRREARLRAGVDGSPSSPPAPQPPAVPPAEPEAPSRELRLRLDGRVGDRVGLARKGKRPEV